MKITNSKKTREKKNMPTVYFLCKNSNTFKHYTEMVDIAMVS